MGTIRVEAGCDRLEREEIEPKSEDGHRRVPAAAILRDVLLEHRMNGMREGYVLGATPAPSVRGQRAVQARTQGVAAAGLEPIKLHDCRHVFASVMIAPGINAKALSTYVGTRRSASHSICTVT